MQQQKYKNSLCVTTVTTFIHNDIWSNGSIVYFV